jgi:zinc protease
VPAIDQLIETPDKANAVFRAGLNLRLRDDHPDYAALVLGNYLLGGSSDARLARRVREKEGLSYSVGSWLSASSQDEAGGFGVYAIYAPHNRPRVEAAIAEELRRALEEGFTAQEVEDARRGLLQARKMARNSDAGLAGRLAGYSAIGRTLAWDIAFEKRIAELTPAEVRDALRRHLALGKLSVVKAGDFKPGAARTAATPK